MSLPRTVGEILREHTTLEVQSIDRMYRNVYVPGLQSEGSGAWVVRTHRGQRFASSALMAPMSTAVVAAIEAFGAEHTLPRIPFAKGQRKADGRAQPRARCTGAEGILVGGKAQEKTGVFRTARRRNPQTGQPYPWRVRSTAMVNPDDFYGIDRDVGPLFLKFCAYFPYNAKRCLNGQASVKRQLAQPGIAYAALDNGIVSCADPRPRQALGDGRLAAKIEARLRKWLARRPPPVTGRDRRAGSRDPRSIRQAEFSLTPGLDRPVTGRLFLDAGIRETRALGRPDHVPLLVDRRGSTPTPGRFRTRGIPAGVPPARSGDDTHRRIKPYPKAGRALRTETPINTADDCDIGRRRSHLSALRRSAFRPPAVAGTSSGSAPTARSGTSRSPGSPGRRRSRGNGPPRCASPPRSSTRC